MPDKVAEDVVQFLNYEATHANVEIQYHDSGVVLHAESYVSYLSVSKVRSWVEGNHYSTSSLADDKNSP